MNKLNFLSRLWRGKAANAGGSGGRRSSELQSNDAVLMSDGAYIEHPFSICSAYIGTRWKPAGKLLKVMTRMAAVVCLLFTLGVGNVLGTDYTYSPTGSYTASGGKSTSNGKEWTYSSATYLGLNNSKIQVGSKNNPQTSDWTIQIPVSSFGTVTKVQLTAYTTATSASYKIGINGNTTSGSLSTSSATYTKTYTATSGDIVITLKGSANSKAMYLCSIVVTYTAASYTITYNANGGSGSMSNTTGASVNAAANGFTAPAGKQFTGWNTAANGSGTSYAAGASVNATVTLYAQWGCITPSISVHPSNGSCVQGGSPTPLTVTASGGTLSYQWKECSTSGGTYVNVTGGSGGTSASYTPPVSSVGTMYYKCVVTNTGSSCGTTATSNYASFEVTEACSAPTINTHPTGGVTYNMNVTATALSVTATKNGTGPALTYQWYSNTSNSNSTGTIIAGATSSSYTPPTSAAGTKYYYCIVSSGACSTPSNTAAITVSTPTITVSETARAFGDRKVNGGPYELTLTVGGTTLANGQGIGLAITGTNAAMFAIKNSVTSIAQTSSGTVATTTVTVQYSPTGAGSHSATLTFSSTGATSKMVALTGTGKWEVTWSNNGATSTTLVENSTKPTFPSTPLSCDATSTTFIGWATAEWDGKIASLAGKTVHTSNSTMSNITANGTTFYAVFAKQSGSGDPTWVQTTSVAENDVVVIAEIDHYADGKTGKELAGWGGSTYGTGTDYTTTPAGTITWTVVTGYNSTGVAFKNSSNKYLYWGSSNSLDVNSTLSANSSWSVSEESSRAKIQNNATNTRVICWNEASPRFAAYDSKSHEQETSNGASTKFYYPVFYKQTPGYTYSDYLTTCCSDPELAYGTASVTKTFGASAFTNTLTNSHSVAVTYASSDPTVATVDGSGEVTILKAGSTTITASSIAQTVSTVDYCADEASYTLTVNKASISPTLTYSPASVAVDANSNAPSVSDNTGSGTVTYAITDAKPAGCATINASTGVVTGVAVGSVTVTATVGATTNYNGNTATATVTITAASYFTNGETVFIQADSKDYSAWKDDACVKAWFNNNWSGGSAETTYWLFDATDDDAGKKLFAAVVPSASLNQVQLQRFAGNCSDKWNDNGSVTKASSNGVNTFRSYGSADNNVAWNGSSTILYLYGSQNSWGSSLGTFADQGSGVWTATLSNYAPDATSKDYKIKTSYNNGWIGNTGNNDNATLSGMTVGSTYNVTATLNVTTHSLTMSKTFVKGTVSFDLQGHGSAISDLTNITAGSKISAPSEPSAEGYTFGGWYKEAGCENAWDFANDVVNETMTLYAKWTINSHTLSWNWNGGSTSSTTHTAGGSVTYGATITKPANGTMSRIGYDFSGWSTDATTMPDNDLTITAQWTAKEYSVTLDREGASTGSTSVTMTYNSSSHTAITAPTKTGYDFGGWYTGDDGTGNQVMNASGVLQANVDGYTGAGGVWTRTTTPTTLYAKWTLKTTTVSFNQNSGTGGQTGTLTATYGSAMPTPITTPTRAGYTFTGYYENSGGTGTKYYNADGTSATNWNKENATWTLYAGWSAKTDTYKTALHTGASAWTTYASGHTESGAQYNIPDPGSVAKGGSSTCEDLHYHFAGWVEDDYKGSPSGHIIAASGKADATGTTYWAVWEEETDAGTEESDELNTSNVDASGTANNQWENITVTGSTGATYYIHTMGTYNSTEAIRWNNNGYLYCSGAPTSGKKLLSVSITTTTDKSIGIYGSNSAYSSKPSETSCSTFTAKSTGPTYNFVTNEKDFAYIGLVGTTSSTYINSIIITYGTPPTYGDPKAVCEACAVTATVGAATLKGDFSLSSVGVTCPTSGTEVGANCAWLDYGFVWSPSSNTTPTIGGTNCTKVQTGTTGSSNTWDDDLESTFVVGNTYYYRAYGKNGKADADFVYGTVNSFTPRSVTFNLNGHGESTPATQYVNNGGKAADPSYSEVVTGWTFGGWYKEVGCTNAWTFGTDVVSGANAVIYAKWTAKTSTVTLDPNGGSGSNQTVSATYGTDMPLVTTAVGTPAIVVPSRDGYDFAGYYDTNESSGGTQYYSYTGSPKALGSARTWNKEGAQTLYARWTVHTHAIAVSAADHVVITATPAGGSAIAEGGSNASVDYNKTITLNCTPDDHWSLAWDVYKTGESSTKVALTGDGDGATFAMPDYAVTVTAVMTEATYHTATFKNNGAVIAGYDGVKTYDGERPSAPTLTDITDACDKTDCNKFYGWIAEAGIWDRTINSVAGKTIYRNASSIPVVSGADVVYHAVWAKGTGVDISSTLIAKWGKFSLVADQSEKATDANGTTLNDVTLTPNISTNQTGGNYGCNSSGVNKAPEIVIAGLDYSSYSKGGLSFYSRSSTSATLSIWVSDDGSDYGESALTTVTTASSKEHLFTINNIPNTTGYIKIVSNNNSGSFYFGTVRAYGINASPTYDFTELTSENTSGWTTNNWDGYYIITFGSTPTALLSSGIEGWYGLRDVSASSSKITTADIDLMFKVTFSSSANEGAGGYSVQGLAGGDYIATAKVSEAYHIMTPTVAYLSSIDYNQILMSTGKALRYNTSSTPYRSGEYGPTYGGAPTLYKIMEEFTEFRIKCCDNTVTIGTPTKTGSGTVTFASGGNAYAASDEVETCAGATTITATVTPTNGYQCTALEFTRSDSEDLDPDPAISVPFTGAQSYDLTFEQNADGVTLNTSVTFVALMDHYIDNMHYNTTQNKSGNYGTAPTLSDESKGSECTGLHYRFIGWIPEGDMNMTTGVPTTTANMVAGGATGKYATGTNYYAIWAEEE